MSDGPNSITEVILRHAGSNRPSSGHQGNTQFAGRSVSGHGGLMRSCGKCGAHRPQEGSGRWRGMWVAYCCKPAEKVPA